MRILKHLINSFFGPDAWIVFQKNRSFFLKAALPKLLLAIAIFFSTFHYSPHLGATIKSLMIPLGTFIFYDTYVNIRNYIMAIKQRDIASLLMVKTTGDLLNDLTNLVAKIDETVKSHPNIKLRPLPSGMLFLERLSTLKELCSAFNNQYFNIITDTNRLIDCTTLNLVNQLYQYSYEIKPNIEMLANINTLERRIQYEQLTPDKKSAEGSSYYKIYQEALPVLESRKNKIKTNFKALKAHHNYKAIFLLEEQIIKENEPETN